MNNKDRYQRTFSKVTTSTDFLEGVRNMEDNSNKKSLIKTTVLFISFAFILMTVFSIFCVRSSITHGGNRTLILENNSISYRKVMNYNNPSLDDTGWVIEEDGKIYFEYYDKTIDITDKFIDTECAFEVIHNNDKRYVSIGKDENGKVKYCIISDDGYHTRNETLNEAMNMTKDDYGYFIEEDGKMFFQLYDQKIDITNKFWKNECGIVIRHNHNKKYISIGLDDKGRVAGWLISDDGFHTNNEIYNKWLMFLDSLNLL